MRSYAQQMSASSDSEWRCEHVTGLLCSHGMFYTSLLKLDYTYTVFTCFILPHYVCCISCSNSLATMSEGGTIKRFFSFRLSCTKINKSSKKRISQYFWFLVPLSFSNSTLADLLCKYQIYARNVIILWAFFNNHVYTVSRKKVPIYFCL